MDEQDDRMVPERWADEKPPRVSVVPLEYERVSPNGKFSRRSFVLGIIFAPLYVVTVLLVEGMLRGPSTVILAWGSVGLLLAILVAEQRRTRSWAFVAGALTGILVLPLIGFTLCCILLSMSRM